ncbi:helix-turn-helix domain-containing protein [Peptostreptococcus faecalis]|uniref:helix-turn-helix domain-containing protein n=1 Tax=Peptostreptococcus faecalis TaxID=2045015 RepID=UPI001FA85C5D|nr:helix-turn-helix domain-containing protein [Peptostreptococcus faecalis]
MSYKHLSINKRVKIEVLNKKGYSARKISTILDSHHYTISRETKRCPNNYSAQNADTNSKTLSKNKGGKVKITSSLKIFIENCIKNHGLLNK